jgi:hypothetical protein
VYIQGRTSPLFLRLFDCSIVRLFDCSQGVEEVLFEPAVPLEGKAEVYLQKILTGMRSTLKNRLRESTERYPGQERTRWLMDKGSDDAPTDPAQISLLTSMIYYARAVETAFRYVLATSTSCDIDIDILRHRHLATSCDIDIDILVVLVVSLPVPAYEKTGSDHFAC